MALSFRFQTILDLRKRTEEERQMALALAMQAAVALRRQEAQVQEEQSRLSARLAAALGHAWNPEEVQQHYRYLDSLQARRLRLAEEVTAAEAAVTEERNRLAEAMKERKTLEKLKEQERKAFLESHQKKEQTEMDDLNVARFSRPRWEP